MLNRNKNYAGCKYFVFGGTYKIDDYFFGAAKTLLGAKRIVNKNINQILGGMPYVYSIENVDAETLTLKPGKSDIYGYSDINPINDLTGKQIEKFRRNYATV